MELPLAEIRQILGQEDEGGVGGIGAAQGFTSSKINQFRNVVRSLDEFISEERQARIMITSRSRACKRGCWSRW